MLLVVAASDPEAILAKPSKQGPQIVVCVCAPMPALPRFRFPDSPIPIPPAGGGACATD